MGARQKLNSAHFNGAVVLGLLGGAASGSPAVGILVFAALLLSAFAGGDIRPDRRKGP